MTDDEFNQFVQHARDELERKQAALTRAHGLGEHSNFLFDQTTGKLQFKDASGTVVVEASTTPLGSFSATSGTWQWGWSNKSLLAPLRERSERLKALKAWTGMAVFANESFKADEAMAGELAAMCVEHLGALGCYRIPARHLLVFLAIDSVAAKR